MASRAEAQKVIPQGDADTGPEVSTSIARAVVSILDILRDVPPAYRLQVLRIAESVIRGSDVVRKLTKVGRGSYQVALPMEMKSLMGTYRASIVSNKIILTPDKEADARIRLYGDRLKLMLPKRLVEAIGSPSYVRVRVEGSHIIIEPA